MSSPLLELNKHLERLRETGNYFLKIGKLDEAAASYHQLLEIRPNDLNSLYLLALIVSQQNKTKDAISLLSKALTLSPNNAEILIELGNLHTKEKNYQKAIEFYEKLLEINSTNHGVYCCLAQNYALLNNHRKAIKTLQEGLNIHPNQEVLYLLLANQLIHLLDSFAANEVLRSCYKKGFRSLKLFTALAFSYSSIGQIQDAKECYQEAYQIYPDHLYFLYHLSRINPEILTDDVYRLLTEKLNSDTLSKDSRAYCQYLIAHYLRKKGDFSDEIYHLIAGHRDFKQAASFELNTSYYLKELPKFSRKQKKPILKSNTANHSIDTKTLKPIFIMGVPRSGSTLVESVLSTNKQIFKSMEESGFILDAHRKACLNKNNTYNSTFISFVNDYLQKHELNDKQCRFTDKSLENFYFLDVIFNTFPEAKIIWTKRHPLASIVSILQNNLVNLSWAHDIHDILEYFKITLDTIDYWNNKYKDKIYTVNYENFVANPEEESQALFEFCELDWNQDCLQKFKQKSSKTASAAQIRKGIHTGAARTYESYIPLFEKYVQKYPWLNNY